MVVTMGVHAVSADVTERVWCEGYAMGELSCDLAVVASAGTAEGELCPDSYHDDDACVDIDTNAATIGDGCPAEA